MIISIFWVLLGGALLFVGGHYLVDHAVKLAWALRIPKAVVAMTVVAFGTSAPELVVSLDAAASDHDALVIGNILGSNIANVVLVLALSALIAPFAVARGRLRQDGLVMLAGTAAFYAVALTGHFNRAMGLLFLLGMALFLWNSFRKDHGDLEEFENIVEHGRPMGMALHGAIIVGALLALALGAHWFVKGAVEMAAWFGVSEAVIGLTVVAVGSCAPEIVTSVMAAFKRHSEVALGNVLGSNLFNIVGITGVTAVVFPLQISSEFLRLDMPMVLITSLAVVLWGLMFRRMGRVFGGLCLVVYGGYITTLFLA